MTNLPSNPTASTPSLPERVAHREWIGGRALTLLSHYWRDDDPVELTSAIGQDWADVLEGLPQEFIQRACIHYQRTEPRRKPTPGAVYAIAKSLVPRPSPVPEPEPRPRDRITPEQARKVLDDAGVRLNKFGGVESL